VIIINCTFLVGRLVKDIELQYLQNSKNCLFTLAVDRGFKDESGNKQADFISCVAWNGQAEFLSKYCKKGDRIGVKGRIQTRNYQAQDGTTRFITEVVCDTVESYEPRQAQQQEQPQQQPQQEPKHSGMKVNGKQYNVVDDNDPLPF
jgi:single-strand DNA-binding protein